MQYSYLEFPLAEDSIWFLLVPELTTPLVSSLLTDPETFVNSRVTQGSPLEFNKTIPIDFLFCYDLKAGDPTIIHGVRETNRISIRLPQRFLEDRAELAEESIRVIDPKVHIVLFDSLKIGFAHFHPAKDDGPIYDNFGLMITGPRRLGTFLEQKEADHIVSVVDANGKRTELTEGKPTIEFMPSPNLHLHVQSLAATAQCAKTDASGNCVKIQGQFNTNSEGKTIFNVSEIWQIPYCPVEDSIPVAKAEQLATETIIAQK